MGLQPTIEQQQRQKAIEKKYSKITGGSNESIERKQAA